MSYLAQNAIKLGVLQRAEDLNPVKEMGRVARADEKERGNKVETSSAHTRLKSGSRSHNCHVSLHLQFDRTY